MVGQNDVRILKLFNEKAEKLAATSFAKIVAAEGTSVTYSGDSSGKVEISRIGQTEELMDAFVLTLRFFVQDNESCSIRNLGKIYHQLPDQDEQRKQFEDARRKLNHFLDSPSFIRIDEALLTHREIYDVFVYGEAAHANERKRMAYRAWMKNSLAIPLLQNQRDHVFRALLVVITYMARLNSDLLLRFQSAEVS